LIVDAASARWLPVRVQAPPGAAAAGSHPIDFVVSTQDAQQDAVIEKSVFLVPR
jgi:IG-like fold at C-terminal of FixG, putative oxidoreductase